MPLQETVEVGIIGMDQATLAFDSASFLTTTAQAQWGRAPIQALPLRSHSGWTEPAILPGSRRVARQPEAGGNGVQFVFGVGHPFQIRHMIIRLDAINVIDLMLRFWRGPQKGFGHQAMDETHPRAAIDHQAHPEIHPEFLRSDLNQGLDVSGAVMGVRCFAAHTSPRGNGIRTIGAFNGAPLFDIVKVRHAELTPSPGVGGPVTVSAVRAHRIVGGRAG